MSRPRTYVDVVGKRYGRLVVTDDVQVGRRRHVVARCDCGRSVTRLFSNVVKGHTHSCGCLGREVSKAHGMARRGAPLTHGLSRLPEYAIWEGIVQRCTNPRDKHYSYYGGRGITICGEWRRSFPAFLQHVGRRPRPELTLDRIDNERGYEPGNLRWATRLEQAHNKRPRRWFKRPVEVSA